MTKALADTTVKPPIDDVTCKMQSIMTAASLHGIASERFIQTLEVYGLLKHVGWVPKYMSTDTDIKTFEGLFFPPHHNATDGDEFMERVATTTSKHSNDSSPLTP
jgi:hypothetical protein